MDKFLKDGIFSAAKAQWGKDRQVIAAAEEFSEASAAMCRFANGKVKNLHEVITELADAEIMLEQMRLYFDPVEIDAEKDRKLIRLAHRLGLMSEVQTN